MKKVFCFFFSKKKTFLPPVGEASKQFFFEKKNHKTFIHE